MKRLILIISFLTLICLDGTAQEDKKAIKGFSGGMMVHTGFLSGCDNPYNYDAAGTTFGIGGVAKLHLTKHFRAGFEGYFSTMGLHEDIADGSHNKVFWTGALCDWYWKIGRFYPYVGATVGGGMETSLYMFQGNTNDWEPETEIIYRKQPFAYCGELLNQNRHSMPCKDYYK